MSKKDNLFSLLMILLILVVLAFLIHNFIYDINIFKTKTDEMVIESDTDEYRLTYLPNDPIKGETSFPVMIYLFADYESNNLKEVVDIIDSLILKYSNRVALVWKDFPLVTNYFSRGAALATRCALDEEKYWEYNHRLINREDSLSLDLYQKIASDLEMNVNNFLSCYKSGKYLYDIENNMREAYVLDIEEVPTIFINQERIEGEINFEKLDQIISNLIK